MRYEVTAFFERPINGRIARSCDDPGGELLFADGEPESAARMWLWRLSAEEREATVRVVVSAPRVTEYKCYPLYKGPSFEFVRVGGQLEAVPDPSGGYG